MGRAWLGLAMWFGVACVGTMSEAPAPSSDSSFLQRSVDGTLIERSSPNRLAATDCAGDFNADGFDDVAAVRPESTTVSTLTLHVHEGSRRFPQPATTAPAGIPETGWVGCWAPGDVNGDGYDDLFIATADGWLLYRGSSTGLSTRWGLETPGDGKMLSPPGPLANAGDLDGDGDEEVWLLHDSKVSLHLGTPTGLSATPFTTITPTGGYTVESTRQIVTADTDGDGVRELFAGGSYYERNADWETAGYEEYTGVLVLALAQDTTTGTWRTQTQLGGYHYDSRTGDSYGLGTLLAAADLPTPGDEAIVYAQTRSNGSPRSRIYDRCTLAGCTRVFDDPGAYIEKAAVSDLDGDGQSELLLIDGRGPTIHAVEGSTPAVTTFPITTWHGALGTPGDYRGTGSADTLILSHNVIGWLQAEGEPDADEDGIADSTDNCPAVSNPDQLDNDGDGAGDACDQCQGDDQTGDADEDGFCLDLDCEDGDPFSHPEAPERCDGLDNDCEGSLPADESDADADGYVACTAIDGADLPIDGGDDCDDADASVHPDADEICDGIDSDCAGGPAEDEVDVDADGYVACTIDTGGWDGSADVVGGGDCVPTDPTAYPGGTELCDGLDNDCDGSIGPGEIDADGDGYTVCDLDDGGWDGAGEVVGGGDCDDSDPDGWPGSASYDEDCQPRGCGGCSASGATSSPGGLILIGFLAVTVAGRRRRSRAPALRSMRRRRRA